MSCIRKQVALCLIAWIIAATAGCATSVVTEQQPVPSQLWDRDSVVNAIKEPDDDPDALCPADTRLYLRVDNLADWRNHRDVDPLVEHVWQAIETLKPPTIWQQAMDRLNLDEGAMADAMFGKCTVLVVHRFDGHEVPFVLTRISPQLAKRLPKAFGLKPWETQPTLGPMQLFTVDDKKSSLIMMLSNRWLAIGESRGIDPMRHWFCSVAAGNSSISHSKQTLSLMATLPSQRDVLMLVSSRRAHHAAAVVRKHRSITVHYTADYPNLKRIDEQHVKTDGVNFGPLPANTISAVSINLFNRGQRVPRLLNLILFPHRFRPHVLDRLSPPVVAFLGSVPGHRIKPNPGVDVPALGVALHMSDPRAARVLDRLVVGLHRIINLGELDLLRFMFGVRRVNKNGERYHVANFGDAILKRAKGSPLADLLQMPSSAGLTHITFGPVGDWYVICSQEALFLDCRTAAADDKQRLDPLTVIQSKPGEHLPSDILLNGFTQVSKLAPLLNNTVDFWQLSGLGKSNNQYDAPLRWIASGLEHRQSLSFQIWREGPTRLRGHLHVTGTPPS